MKRTVADYKRMAERVCARIDWTAADLREYLFEGYAVGYFTSAEMGHEVCRDLYHLLDFQEWRRARDQRVAALTP